MKTIASFTVNHDLLQKGMYTSRADGDVVTYDIRMKVPNAGDYLSDGCMHAIEHLFATYARNTEYSENIVYVGPMGCRTGFYLLVRDAIDPATAIQIARESMEFIASFEGDIPGASRIQCGNWLDFDLPAAKDVGRDMAGVLADWTPGDLKYRE